MWCEAGSTSHDEQGRQGPPPRARRRRLVGVLGIAGVGLLGGLAAPVQAATVDLHAAPVALGAGDCSSAADACTIGVAVTDANAASTDDSVRILLARGNYVLNAPSPTALPVTFAGPSLTFEAPNGTATLNGRNAVRLLSVGAASNVTVDGLTFVGGSTSGLGGAIENAGTLAIRNAMLSSNTGGNGGAISNSVGATLRVEDSTLAYNTATSVGGGAIIGFGSVTIVRSAIVNNDAPINGGGINVQPNGTATISSSTIAGNTAGGLGGGISNLGALNVQKSTIADNTASDGAVIATGNANVTAAGSILAAQSSGNGCSPANVTITDAGYNLDHDGTCISATEPAVGSHSGTSEYGPSTYAAALDAYLADRLASNGGPTKSFALLNTPNPLFAAANPAFDVVPASFELPVAVDGASTACALPDQRGVVAAAGADCAIGAYLLQATSTDLRPSASSVGQNGSVTYTATVAPAPEGGTVSFDDGAGNPASSQCAAQRVAGGIATCTVSYPRAGAYYVTASYSGDGDRNDHAASVSTPQAVTVTTPVIAPPLVPSPPVLQLSKLSVTRCIGTAKGLPRSPTVSFAVNVPSTVTFTLQRRAKVLPSFVQWRCPRVLSPGPSGDYVNVSGTAGRAGVRAAKSTAATTTRALSTTTSVAAGTHKLSLKKLLGSASLEPGRYRVLVQVVDAAGVKVERPAYFWVLQPKAKKAAKKAKRAAKAKVVAKTSAGGGLLVVPDR